MPKPVRKQVVLVTVPDKMMSALRAYWTVLDLDQGPRAKNFWDLRFAAVNRWASEDIWPPHIRYTLMFKRGDKINELEYAEKHGAFPSSPPAWEIAFDKGTFPEHFNPDFDTWISEHMAEISRVEEQRGQESAWDYVRKHAPPEQLSNPDNWSPEQAAEELRELMPMAIELFESERQPIDWKPKGFIV